MNDISDADRELFRQSVGAVRKIRHKSVACRKPRSSRPVSGSARFRAQTIIEGINSGIAPAGHLRPADILLFKRPGIQDKLFDKLRRGHLSIERQLDLHGLTVADALAGLGHFLLQCRQQNVRCARIIHGKGRGSAGGRPVIKNELNRWLQKHTDVLAFCSAPHHDGGAGAVYVLLKNTGQSQTQ